MSSAGARPAGSDGADYMHRERIANQHTDSVRYKAQLTRYLWPLACAQLFSFAMLVVTLMNRSFVQYDRACLFRAAVRCLIVLSLLGTLLMMRAMPRNDSAKMQSGYLLLLFLGLLPAFVQCALLSSTFAIPAVAKLFAPSQVGLVPPEVDLAITVITLLLLLRCLTVARSLGQCWAYTRSR